MIKSDKPACAGHLGRAIDEMAILELTGMGLARPFYQALQEVQPGYMCQGGAEFMVGALSKTGARAVIVTGFPMGGGVAETDGPVGAAMLAKALLTAFGVQAVMVSDMGWEAPVEGACTGAGLSPQPYSTTRGEQIKYLKAVHTYYLDKDDAKSAAQARELMTEYKPDLLISIERPGKNTCGSCHGMNGRTLDGNIANADELAIYAREKNIPWLAIGDGGNELGMGKIFDNVCTLLPQATSCGCPCGGGTASILAADYLVVSCVSNWGADCLVAALAAHLGRIDIMHTPDELLRCLKHCASAGAVDGVALAPIDAADGVSGQEWFGLVAALRGTLIRSMGLCHDWRHDLEG